MYTGLESFELEVCCNVVTKEYYFLPSFWVFPGKNIKLCECSYNLLLPLKLVFGHENISLDIKLTLIVLSSTY